MYTNIIIIIILEKSQFHYKKEIQFL